MPVSHPQPRGDSATGRLQFAHTFVFAIDIGTGRSRARRESPTSGMVISQLFDGICRSTHGNASSRDLPTLGKHGSLTASTHYHKSPTPTQAFQVGGDCRASGRVLAVVTRYPGKLCISFVQWCNRKNTGHWSRGGFIVTGHVTVLSEFASGGRNARSAPGGAQLNPCVGFAESSEITSGIRTPEPAVNPDRAQRQARIVSTIPSGPSSVRPIDEQTQPGTEWPPSKLAGGARDKAS